MKLYYGEETKKALKNFPFSNSKIKKEFILSMVKIKKAAAVANSRTSTISKEIKDAILESCDEIISGKFNDQFPLSSLQGGAGTAIHMNVNEVIANRATEILKNKVIVHPNDDVNCCQSTNDVNPSALKISLLYLLEELNTKLFILSKSFKDKANEFKNINKLGRTHLQDAVPTTIGAEFLAYYFNVKRHCLELKRAQALCLNLNLGGTAIGNSINASPIYVKYLYEELNKITGYKFRKSDNLMAKTSSQVDFLMISQIITSLTLDLSKIANDFKFMASGPRGGIGEIILPEIQKGSSIMPGKINPVIPETVNQLYYIVSGNNLSIEKAVEGAQLELGVMLPVIVDKLIESVKITIEVVVQFDKLCVSVISVDKEACSRNLENSTAYATLLVPCLGYDCVSEIVKKSIKTKKTLREVVIEDGYLDSKEFDKITKTSNILR